MKRIALVFIIIFALVQLAPAVVAVMKDVHSFFIADEEKSDQKGNLDIKEKKFEVDFSSPTVDVYQCQSPAFHFADQILPSPPAEKLTPPPNFY